MGGPLQRSNEWVVRNAPSHLVRHDQNNDDARATVFLEQMGTDDFHLPCYRLRWAQPAKSLPRGRNRGGEKPGSVPKLHSDMSFS